MKKVVLFLSFIMLITLFCSCGYQEEVKDVERPKLEIKNRVLTDTDLHPGLEFA